MFKKKDAPEAIDPTGIVEANRKVQELSDQLSDQLSILLNKQLQRFQRETGLTITNIKVQQHDAGDKIGPLVQVVTNHSGFRDYHTDAEVMKARALTTQKGVQRDAVKR